MYAMQFARTESVQSHMKYSPVSRAGNSTLLTKFIFLWLTVFTVRSDRSVSTVTSMFRIRIHMIRRCRTIRAKQTGVANC
jgi:hypothetical protein